MCREDRMYIILQGGYSSVQIWYSVQIWNFLSHLLKALEVVLSLVRAFIPNLISIQERLASLFWLISSYKTTENSFSTGRRKEGRSLKDCFGFFFFLSESHCSSLRSRLVFFYDTYNKDKRCSRIRVKTQLFMVHRAYMYRTEGTW